MKLMAKEPEPGAYVVTEWWEAGFLPILLCTFVTACTHARARTHTHTHTRAHAHSDTHTHTHAHSDRNTHSPSLSISIATWISHVFVQGTITLILLCQANQMPYWQSATRILTKLASSILMRWVTFVTRNFPLGVFCNFKFGLHGVFWQGISWTRTRSALHFCTELSPLLMDVKLPDILKVVTPALHTLQSIFFLMRLQRFWVSASSVSFWTTAECDYHHAIHAVWLSWKRQMQH